ncbi:MAG: S-layer homology domain-containing protein [Syntrophothermus sp.]|uniref:S-layer homology domain-containing protein n=1 Tax=Syntrophothermus sp. TaxID=2736299 RepID=UPI0025810720|nr:S-layer homology domain-containing protein [Syntrophothermus sp.]NSW83574.1 S-layer homology domain-containing protein [Syntrophothermus sp.]
MPKRAGLIVTCLVILAMGVLAGTAKAGQPPSPTGVPISNVLQGEVHVTSPPSTGGGGGGGVSSPTPVIPPGAATPVSDEALAQALEEAKETGVVALAVSAGEKVLALTVTQLQKVSQAEKPVVLSISEVKFTLPPAAVKALAGVEAVQVEVAAVKLATEEAKRLVAGAVNASGLRLVGDVFELNAMTVAQDGTKQVVKRFGSAIRVSLPVPEEAKEAAAAGKLDAHRYDEATNTWVALGGTYDAQAGAIVFETNRLSKYAVLEKVPPKTFADIQGHWAQADIEALAALGIARGIGQDRFAPDAQVTRAEFAAFLLRALGIEEKKPMESHFRDISPSEWYFGAVETAREAELISGYPDGTFRPMAPITREEIACMIQRAMVRAGKKIAVAGEVEKILARFTDASEVSPWAREGVAAVVKEGIIRGRTPVSLVPQGKATRAEAIVMVRRMLASLGKI